MENFLYNYSYSSSSNSSSNKSGKDSSSIFRNLDISDFSTSKSKHWYNASCKVKNNNAFTVKGYFRANFYDQDGELLYNQLMSLPDVGTGESVVCSTMISLDNYPVDYDYVEFTQETLVESD